VVRLSLSETARLAGGSKIDRHVRLYCRQCAERIDTYNRRLKYNRRASVGAGTVAIAGVAAIGVILGGVALSVRLARQPSGMVAAAAPALRPAVAPQDRPAPLPDPYRPAPRPWAHVTATGVRWNLRRIEPVSRTLTLDIGGDQVASVVVPPEFETLNLTVMNARVDAVFAAITRSFPLRSARYTFGNDGMIRPLAGSE
jgi:hypothetical protein